MKRLFACFAVLFGSVGILACLACAVGIWPATERFVDRGEDLADEADRVLTSVGGRFDVWNRRLTKVDRRLDEVANDCRKLSGLLKSSEADRQRVDELNRKLTALSETISTTLDGLDSAAKSLRNVANTLKSLSTFQRATQSEQDPRVAGLESLAAAIEKVASLLKPVRAKLKKDAGTNDVKQRATAMLSVIEPLHAATSDLRSRVVRCNEVVSGAQADLTLVRWWLQTLSRFGPLLVTAVCFWMAIGQWSLAAWGWRNRRRVVPPADI